MNEDMTTAEELKRVATPTTPPSEPPTEKEPIDEIIQFTERAANAIMDFMLADAEFRGWRPPEEGDRP